MLSPVFLFLMLTPAREEYVCVFHLLILSAIGLVMATPVSVSFLTQLNISLFSFYRANISPQYQQRNKWLMESLVLSPKVSRLS